MPEPRVPYDGAPWAMSAAGFDPLPEHAQLTEGARVHVIAALTRWARGERVTWDVALDLAPTPTGPAPVVVVYLHMPSAVLGEVVGELVLLQPNEITGQNVDTLLGQAIERMRAARSNEARQVGETARIIAPRR